MTVRFHNLIHSLTHTYTHNTHTHTLTHTHINTHNSYSFYIIAKILFAYATFASFLLQFYVPMDFLEPAILEKMKLNTTARSEFKVIVQVFFRSVTVLFIGEQQIEKVH